MIISRRNLIIALTLVAMLTAISPQAANAQTSDSVYITETGHWIWGEFLKVYNSVSDPLLYFGYPITDEFTDPVTGLRVQYFERARLDQVETPEGLRVQVAPLGALLHIETGIKADIPNEGPTCQKFESGFSVCYAFLQFYEAYAGDTWFGEPISEVEVADGHYVQYFVNARMEWWPDRPAGERVALANLGRIYFDGYVGNPDLLKSSPPEGLSGQLLHPTANVFAVKGLIGSGEQQTIFVIAQDQFLRPVANAETGVTLYYPNGSKTFYRLPPTNEFGISQISFQVDGLLQVKDVVNVATEINLRGEYASGRTWFQIWW